MSEHERGQRGFALVTVMMVLALLMSLIVAYYTLTSIELSTLRSSMSSTRGLYAAEGGLNLRADEVRRIFEGYNRPAGTSPDTATAPCSTGNEGSGDFACAQYALQQRSVTTFLNEQPGNPTAIVVPRGEQFQNLHAQEYRYDVISRADNREGRPEALLELKFKSRLIPMFQFAAFYNKDLEILPGPTMNLEGPVHTNGDLYLGSGAMLNMYGQVTTAGDVFHGRKDDNICLAGGVAVMDPSALAGLPPCLGFTTRLDQSALDAWNGMIRTGVEPLTVPPPEALDPSPGEIYWDRADVRIMLDLDGGVPSIEVRNPDGSADSAATAALAGCGGAAAHTNSFYNNREGANIEMLDIDARGLLDCIHAHPVLSGGKDIDDTSEGGLVWYFGVDGTASPNVNNYGVRVRNGRELDGTAALAPEVAGLTVVTNQAAYVQGDFNAVNKKPASFLSDSLNILSNAWSDANSHTWSARTASSTEINAAFLSGTDTTGGASGPFTGGYNGGLENYPRFHENWTGRTLTYRGSFVSLYEPRHVDGPWIYGNPQYTAPNRNWHYDTDFNQAENLPPLSPRFVHLKQELFIRDFQL